MPTVTVTVDASDLASLQHKLETIAPPALTRIVQAAGPYLRDQTRADAPRLTGALASSLVSEGTGFEARVHSPLTYAMPEEFGWRVRGKGGRSVKGRFFLRRAIQMLMQSELPRLFNKAIAELESAWARR